jgi:crossover junction endodeoxyribonuclease RuvC
MINKVRILGIDPGSQVAGFACISSAKDMPVQPRDFIVEGAGAMRLDIKLSHARRIYQLHGVISELIQEFKPSVCVLEKAFCGQNVSSALKLGETRGAVIACVFKHGLDLVEVSPTHVKKTVAGNGRASKDEVAAALKRLLQFDRGNLPFDVSDALAVALTHGLALPLYRVSGGDPAYFKSKR